MNVFGYIGGALISITLIPQIYRTIQIKRVDQLSPVFLLVNLIGTTCMLTYAIQEMLFPVIFTNVIILISTVILCVLHLRYKQETTSTVHDSDQT